jgi:hypothetical protein
MRGLQYRAVLSTAFFDEWSLAIDYVVNCIFDEVPLAYGCLCLAFQGKGAHHGFWVGGGRA